jgi:hypothetical protein
VEMNTPRSDEEDVLLACREGVASTCSALPRDRFDAERGAEEGLRGKEGTGGGIASSRKALRCELPPL